MVWPREWNVADARSLSLQGNESNDVRFGFAATALRCAPSHFYDGAPRFLAAHLHGRRSAGLRSMNQLA